MFFRLEKRIAAAILFSFPYSASALQTAAYLCCPPGCLTALHQRCNQLEQCTDQLLIQWQLLIIFHRYFLTVLQCSLEIGLNILYDTTVIKIAATFKIPWHGQNRAYTHTPECLPPEALDNSSLQCSTQSSYPVYAAGSSSLPPHAAPHNA